MAAFVIGMCNLLIKGLGAVLSVIILLLPDSPFKLLDSSPIAPYLSGINWLVPVGLMLDIGTSWLLAISIYNIYQIAMRWLKMID